MPAPISDAFEIYAILKDSPQPPEPEENNPTSFSTNGRTRLSRAAFFSTRTDHLLSLYSMRT